LTKGGPFKSAFEGKENLKKLISHANKKIIIMPGASITKNNYKTLAEELNVYELHGTKIVGILDN
jgi:copper homeostasis protein